MKKWIASTLFIMMAIGACCYIQRLADDSASLYHTYGEYKQAKEQNNTSEKIVQTVQSDSILLENETSKEESIKKVAYLTFDDGPSDNTQKVLEILAKNKIKATFFMIASEITPEREDMVRQMIKDGHLLGVHTYCHEKNEIYNNADSCVQDFMKAYDKLYEVTGIKPKIYRFPYGSANCYVSNYCNEVIRQMDAKGMVFYDWNVSIEDAVGSPTKSSILKNLKSFTKYNEPVILMHDGSSNKLTSETLPEIIARIKSAGYEFDTVDHRSKPYQWPHSWKTE